MLLQLRCSEKRCMGVSLLTGLHVLLYNQRTTHISAAWTAHLARSGQLLAQRAGIPEEGCFVPSWSQAVRA